MMNYKGPGRMHGPEGSWSTRAEPCKGRRLGESKKKTTNQASCRLGMYDLLTLVLEHVMLIRSLFSCQHFDQLKRKLEEADARARADALEHVTVTSHVFQLFVD